MSYPYGGINAVSLGTGAGSTLQGAAAIAIGFQAGAVSQPASSIVINATGSTLSGVNTNALYVAPIRNLTGGNVVMYDTANSEVVYSTMFTGTFTANNLTALSGVSTSTLNTSTLGASSITVNTLGAQFINYSTLVGSTLSANTVAIASTLTVSTTNATNVTSQFINYSTLTGSTVVSNTALVTSTLSVSTLIASSIFVANQNFSLFSTLTGSSIVTSTLAASTFSTYNALVTSTLTVSTLVASSIFVANQNFSLFSTLTGSSLTASTIAVSTMTGYSGTFTSTLAVSTLVASSIFVANQNFSLFSTLTGSSIVASTLAVSTLSSYNALVTSTLTVSTLVASSIFVANQNFSLFSTLTGSSLTASTLFISTTNTTNLNVLNGSYSTLTGSSISGNVTYANLLLFSSISSVFGSSFGNTGPTGPIGQASQLSYLATGSQTFVPSTALGVVTFNALPDPAQTTGTTGFSFNGTLFTNATSLPIPVAVSYFITLNATQGGYSAVGLTVLGNTTYFGGMYNDTNAFSNMVNVVVPANGTVGLYYMDNGTATVQPSSRVTLTSNQVGQQGPTGWTGTTGPVGNVSQLARTSVGVAGATGATGPQPIAPTPVLTTLIVWPTVDGTQSTGLTGLLYNPNGTFTNTTAMALPINVEYTLNLDTSAGGYSAVGLNGSSNLFGGTYNDSNGFSNSCVVLVPAGSSFGVYYMDSVTVTVQPTSRIICTVLTAGGQGPTGATGPMMQGAVASYTLAATQPLSAGVGAAIVWSTTPDAAQSFSAIGISSPNAGVFTNTSSSTLPVLVEYTVQLNVTGGGSTYVQLGGTASGVFGSMLTSSNIFTNSFTITLIPGATFTVFYYDNSAVNILTTYSRITLTTLLAGPIGPTGLTGPTGTTGTTGTTGPAQWSMTGTTGPYRVGNQTTLSYAQGFVGIGQGATGPNTHLQTTSGGATAGTGSFVPQYQLDVAGSVRAASYTFMDNSALLTASPALDYTTFAQNWSQLGAGTLSSSTAWGGFDMNANGQYQVISSSSTGGVWYSLNYGQTWVQSTGLPVQAYTSVSMSSSGQFQIVGAAVAGTGVLYTSSNYGVSWRAVTGGPTGQWYTFCISASGQYMTGTQNTAGSSIWYSTNYGATWAQATSTPGNYNGICCSASGQYQTVVSQSGSSIFISSNYGQNWIQTTAPSFPWRDVCMSASGQYQTAVINGNNGIYYSSNYGLSWTQASGEPTTGIQWFSVCCSASGQYQVAVMFDSPYNVWYSTNYGVNWSLATIPGPTNPTWTFCEISDNGQYCTAVAQTGHVFQTVIRAPTLYTSGGAIIAGNVGIGTNNPGAILHITNSAVATTYTNKVTMAVSDGIADPSTTYGMINLTRQSDVTDNKGHIAFIRNGNTIQSMGYLQGSNTFGWVANGNMNTSRGIFMTSTGAVGIGTTYPNQRLTINDQILTINGGAAFVVANPSLTNLAPNGVVGQNSINAYFGSASSNYAGGIVMYDITSTANNGWPGTKNIISRLVDTTYIGYISFGSVSDDRGIGFGSNFGTITNPNSTTEKMCILANGNVGIGTTNPAAKLDVNGNLILQGGNINAPSTVSIYASGGGNINLIAPAGGSIGFYSNNGGGSGGLFNPALITSYTTGGVQTGYMNIYHATGAIPDTPYIQCYYGTNVIGTIAQNGTTGITFNPTSDHRLKSNVKPINTPLDTLQKLKPCAFTWTNDNIDDLGFIAHEFAEVFPNKVINNKDEVNEDGSPKYQLMSNTVCIPLLVACVQEQQAQVTQLVSQNATQQAQIDALLQRLAVAGIA